MSIPLIRTSERKDFKRCQQRWYWAWRCGLKTKGRDANALWFGIGVHEALAQWYCGPSAKRGMHPAEYFERWAGDEIEHVKASRTNDFQDDIWAEAKLLGVAMLDSYIRKYGRDEHWDVIAPEQSFQIDIPNRKGTGLQAIYCGTFDLVFRDLNTGRIKLGEHKTEKSPRRTHLSLDEQAGTYWAVASRILESRGLLRRGEVIESIEYNFLRKTLPDERQRNVEGQALNKDGTVSKRQPPKRFERLDVDRTAGERATQLRRIQTDARWMLAARKNPADLMKTPTFDCSWDCSFFEMCEMHEQGGTSWEELRDAVFYQADPYADHRKPA
jgi:hypothetical protein